MNKEEYYKTFRDTFDGVKQASLAELVEKYQSLSDGDRIEYWGYLMKDGSNEIEFAKFVHKQLARFIIETMLRQPRL